MTANGDNDQIVQLAERLLARPHPLGGYPTVELFPGRIPDDAGIELVVPSGGRLLGSALERRDGTLSAVQAIIDVDQRLATAMSAYGAALQSKGWTPSDFGGAEGFVSSGGGLPRMYRKGEDGPLLMIHGTARGAGTAELYLRLDFTGPDWSGYPPGGGMAFRKPWSCYLRCTRPTASAWKVGEVVVPMHCGPHMQPR
jgi:hypothetical protein